MENVSALPSPLGTGATLISSDKQNKPSAYEKHPAYNLISLAGTEQRNTVGVVFVLWREESKTERGGGEKKNKMEV